jgi:hypothetical protein
MVLPVLVLAMLSIFPVTMGRLKFIAIYKTLTIKANKKLPPHIAYLDSSFDVQNSEWNEFEKKTKQPLAVGLSENLRQLGPYVITQKRDLEGFVIRKNAETLVLASDRVYKTGVKTSALAAQEAEGPQWLKNIVRQPPAIMQAITPEPVHNLLAAKRVMGPVEIIGGLAVTNEHHIEVRRADEGVFREMGQVDLMKGSYSIDIDEASGSIVARLIDKRGVILGEGSVRLSQLQVGVSRLIYGPRLEISPSPTWTGMVSYYYSNSKKNKNPPPLVTTFSGQNPVKVGINGEITLENIVKGASTVVRAEAADHMPASKIMVAGAKPFGIALFPNAMMEALKSIVADQNNIAPRELVETSVVWGVATLDGKPLSGVTISSESEPEAQAIYFNEFMIPDPKLTATSSSGLYAFMGLADGFHALLGQRGDSYFGHQNVDVELGSVAIGDIENTLRTEPVRMRAYDAFSGEPISLTANLQSLTQPVSILEGVAAIVLPQVSRLSMMYTEAPQNYVSANYFYNDQDSYIHLPMISRGWLAEIKTIAKINEFSQTGTIVGFFGEESFEAYLAGQTKDSSATIVYFDASGKIVDGQRGTSGGGFVIFNVPYGTQEAVVVGNPSEKIFSKVVPVDPETVSVLSFTSY